MPSSLLLETSMPRAEAKSVNPWLLSDMTPVAARTSGCSPPVPPPHSCGGEGITRREAQRQVVSVTRCPGSLTGQQSMAEISVSHLLVIYVVHSGRGQERPMKDNAEQKAGDRQLPGSRRPCPILDTHCYAQLSRWFWSQRQ